MHDEKGNPKYNTMNSTPLQNVYINQNTYQKQLQECMCHSCKNPNSGCICSNNIKGCNDKIHRNPILGYREQLIYSNTIKPCNQKNIKSTPTNITYKDNYAKKEIVTGLKRNGEIKTEKGESGANNLKLCGYSQTKPHIQNRNGWKNDKYNYSSQQYLGRRCRSFKDQTFNFLSNIPLKDSERSEFLTGCINSTLPPRSTKCIQTSPQNIDCISSNCEQLTCAKKGYTKCEATNNNCKAVYKRNNPRFSTQGAVSSGSRLNRLKYQTQLKAQSTGYVVSGKNNQNKTSMTNNSTSSTSFGIDPFINSVNGFGNAVNGAYPVSLYRSTYPTYKVNLGGLCIGKGQTRNGIPQSCKMSGDCSRTPCNKVNELN
jgi:hypothetical protein